MPSTLKLESSMPWARTGPSPSEERWRQGCPAAWNAHQIPPASLSVRTHENIAPPMLFGHEFNFTDAPNRYDLPPFYPLHVWLWKDNPAGTVEMWNPNVHCDPPALGRKR